MQKDPKIDGLTRAEVLEREEANRNTLLRVEMLEACMDKLLRKICMVYKDTNLDTEKVKSFL